MKDGNIDFIFGLPSNKVLNRLAEPLMKKARAMHAYRQNFDNDETISNTRLFGEFDYGTASWPRAFRVIHKAEVVALRDNPRFIVTSLDLPSPAIVYTQLYCARGNGERYIKELKCDLACDRTSDTTFLPTVCASLPVAPHTN